MVQKGVQVNEEEEGDFSVRAVWSVLNKACSGWQEVGKIKKKSCCGV